MFQTKEGKWRAVCTAPQSQTGIKKPKAFERKTEALARKAMLQWLRETGRYHPAPTMSVSAMMDAYVERCIERKRADKTIRDYKSQRDKHITPAIGHIPVNELTPFDVERMLQTIDGAKAANNVRATLRAAINKIARKADPKLPNVAALAEPESYDRRARVQITWADFAKVFDAEESPVWRAHWLLLAQTGLRPIEARNLTWTEIESHEDGMWIMLAASKTPEGRKPVPLPAETAAAIESLPRTAVYVFPCPGGKACNETTIGNYWREVRDRAGIPKCTLYGLRHLYGSHLARTVSDDILRRLMRHTDVRTTKQYYVEAFRDDLRKAASGVVLRSTKVNKNEGES